jgi:hypothetical protein
VTTRLLSIALGVALIAAVVLGFAWRSASEARDRALHDATADSLARNTQESTTDLKSYVDTVYVPARARLTGALDRLDTVALPPAGRELARECRGFVLTCEARAAKADGVISDLRKELQHAKDPPPGPRLSWRIRAGRDLLAREWEGAAGPRFRIAGPIEAYAELGTRSFRDSLGVRRNEAAISVGGEITFGRRRQ